MDLPTIGALELAVLLSIARLDTEAYGANIRRDVSARAAREHAIGAVYTTLQRVESKGLITSTMSNRLLCVAGAPSDAFA